MLIRLLQSCRFDVATKNLKLRCVRRILHASFKVVHFFTRVTNGAYHTYLSCSLRERRYYVYKLQSIQ